MLNPQVEHMLKVLADSMKAGMVTPARQVMEGTLVCVSEHVPGGGVRYWQQYFELLPIEMRIVLRGHARGDRIAQYKVVGVFDVWAPEIPKNVKFPEVVEV